MPVTCTGGGRVLRAALSGEVDHHGARAIMEELGRQIDLELPRELTLDLAGIAVLLRAYRQVGELGGSLTVVNVPDQAARVLRAAGVDRLIKFA